MGTHPYVELWVGDRFGINTLSRRSGCIRQSAVIEVATRNLGASAYIAKHSARLAQFGITDVRARLFDVNPGLTRLTRGPVE